MGTAPSIIEQRLAQLGITLPDAPKPVAAYVPARRSGNLLFLAGQLPMKDGKLMGTGLVPGTVPPAEAKAMARQCAINALAAAKGLLGSLDKITGVVRVGVFVASEPNFGETPAIANGASELLVEVFGDIGRHARTTVGMASLPLQSPVEVEVTFEVV